MRDPATSPRQQVDLSQSRWTQWARIALSVKMPWLSRRYVTRFRSLEGVRLVADIFGDVDMNPNA